MLNYPLSCYSGDESQISLIALDSYVVLPWKCIIQCQKPLMTLEHKYQCHANNYFLGLADRVHRKTFSMLPAIFSQRKLILDCETTVEWAHLNIMQQIERTRSLRQFHIFIQLLYLQL